MNKPIILKTLDALSPEVVNSGPQPDLTVGAARSKADSRSGAGPDTQRPPGRIVLPPGVLNVEPAYRHWGINE